MHISDIVATNIQLWSYHTMHTRTNSSLSNVTYVFGIMFIGNFTDGGHLVCYEASLPMFTYGNLHICRD